MKKLQHLFVLGLLALLPVFSSTVLAQDGDGDSWEDSNLSKIQITYGDYMLSLATATSEQLLAIGTAKLEYFNGMDELKRTFIYHEDLKLADDELFAAFEAKARAILSEQQLAKLASDGFEGDAPDVGFDPTNWDKSTYIATATDFFLEEYEFLDISPEQAAQLATKQADILALKQWDNYEENMYNAYSETFSASQLVAYNNYKMEQIKAADEAALAELRKAEEDEAAEAEVEPSEDEQALETEIENSVNQRKEEEYEAMFLAGLDKQVKFMRLALELLKNYYIPERANIRAKIDAKISPTDREAIRSLRERYDAFIAKLEQERAPIGNQLGEIRNNEMYNQMAALEAEAKMLEAKELLGINWDGGNRVFEAFLQSERGIFYTAKELAIRYDKLVDGISKENDLLIISWAVQLVPSMPNEQYLPEDLEEQIRKEVIKPEYQTKEVEYRRNIAFLLSRVGEYDPTALHSDRLLHEVSVFPVPASEHQTISFTTANDGMAKVEVVSQDGKLLKSVQTGKLQKGAHQLQVDVRDIPASVYFYRITTAEGVSLVKGMRGE